MVCGNLQQRPAHDTNTVQNLAGHPAREEPGSSLPPETILVDSPLLLNDFVFPALNVTQMCPSEQSLPPGEGKVVSTCRDRDDVNLILDVHLSNVQSVASPAHGTDKSLNVSDTDRTNFTSLSEGQSVSRPTVILP